MISKYNFTNPITLENVIDYINSEIMKIEKKTKNWEVFEVHNSEIVWIKINSRNVLSEMYTEYGNEKERINFDKIILNEATPDTNYVMDIINIYAKKIKTKAQEAINNYIQEINEKPLYWDVAQIQIIRNGFSIIDNLISFVISFNFVYRRKHNLDVVQIK